MTGREQLRVFRQEYFDYVEGIRDSAPSLDPLTEANRRRATTWIESLGVARGIDPYTSRPATDILEARAAHTLTGAHSRGRE